MKSSILHRWFTKTDPAVAFVVGVAAAVTVGALPTDADKMLCGDRTTLYGPLAGIFGSLLGFVIAVLTIVAALLADEKLEIVRSTGLDEKIWRAFLLAAGWCGFACAISVVGLAVDRKPDAPNSPVLVGLLVFATLAAIASVIRSVWILTLLAVAARARSDAARRAPTPAAHVEG